MADSTDTEQESVYKPVGDGKSEIGKEVCTSNIKVRTQCFLSYKRHWPKCNIIYSQFIL